MKSSLVLGLLLTVCLFAGNGVEARSRKLDDVFRTPDFDTTGNVSANGGNCQEVLEEIVRFVEGLEHDKKRNSPMNEMTSVSMPDIDLGRGHKIYVSMQNNPTPENVARFLRWLQDILEQVINWVEKSSDQGKKLERRQADITMPEEAPTAKNRA